MASTSDRFAVNNRKLSVLRLILTGAFVAGLLFILCWIGTFIPFASPTHAYISLFTAAPASSTLALAEGTCWSFAFGAIIGLLIALVYNGLGGIFRD
jgi:hypothetical protein